MKVIGEVIIASAVVIAFTIVGGTINSMKKLRTEAIEHGYAQYCPTNGKWAWKEECE